MNINEGLGLGNSLTDENMIFLKQLGVNHLTVGVGVLGRDEPKGNDFVSRIRGGAYYEADDLVALRKWIEGNGLKLSGIALGLFPRWEKIIIGQAGRDKQIENWNKSIRSMGKAGIPQVQYNCMISAGASMPLWRTSAENVGRGGARIVRFDYSVARKVPITNYGEISAEKMWDNITYFLKATIPVAEETGVTMVMHPAAPQVPSLAGIARIIRSVESFDRVFKIMPSRANSMDFCLGCFSQMMDNEHVYEAIRHFGKAGRIARVDFRGVKGTKEKFDEVFPDDGQLDMLKAVKVLKEVGFNGIIQMDHVPHLTSETDYSNDIASGAIIGGKSSRAFGFGYLKGILQGADALE